MTLVIKPGPIQRVDNYLYQLNTTPGLYLSNLWGGELSPQNGNDPGYLANALKLMLAAEDLRNRLEEALVAFADCLEGSEADPWVIASRAAIAKATK